jgi:Ferritin-like domain
MPRRCHGRTRYCWRVLSRRSLLQAGLASGGALLLASIASAATPDSDLAYLRLLIGVELLSGDFHDRGLGSGKLDADSSGLVTQMRADERAHYSGLATLVTSLGQIPATSDDIDFTYPAGSFASQSAILKLASKIEQLALGAYLGAVENVQTAQLRLPIGQIAANEAQHVSVLQKSLGAKPIGRPFATALSIDTVSAALDSYES